MPSAAGMVSAAEESPCSQQTAKEQSQVAQCSQEVVYLPHGAVFVTSMAVHDRHTCPAVCAIGWSGKRQECAGSSAYTSTRSVITAAVHISSVGHLAQPVPRGLAIKSLYTMHLLSCSPERSLHAQTGSVCCRDLSILRFMRVC